MGLRRLGLLEKSQPINRSEATSVLISYSFLRSTQGQRHYADRDAQRAEKPQFPIAFAKQMPA